MVDVLIVDDDRDLAFLLESLFEHAGLSTAALYDGYACAQYIPENEPPGVVLLDLMLPFRNGFQLLREIRRHPSWQTVPVIILSACNDARDMDRARALGANEYRTKPFVLAELRACVQRYLSDAGAASRPRRSGAP